jgi:Spherulation-specific family 4
MNCAILSSSKPKVLQQQSLAQPLDPSIEAKLPSLDTTERSSEQLALERSLAKPKLKILLPLYIYPNWYERDKYLWKQVALAAQKVPIVAIINPNNGPDNAPPNTDYQQGIKDLRQAGVKIVGYVPTNYTKRELPAVKADIDLYIKHFNVDGIFIDESANTQDKLSYYQQIYKHIKARASRYQVILNPGTDITESYIHEPVADVVVIFENYQKVWTKYNPPAYVKNYAAEHFAALVHTVAADRQSIKNTIDRAAKHKFGYIYITNDSVDTANNNPWDSLPSYWPAQVDYIQKLNAGK